ncbi:heme ABC exporter ATP-binding protein CcmA [Pseudoroseomonas globiformis]|uniref:Heme ABC exporter ATP-binding protein CcmA n=1 Tax=Teichococcus globiformis TaxID=2307229 RepID=A0ABV7G1F6_9PROT
MLEARDIAVLRGERMVFAGLGLRVAPGEAVVLIGTNGAGKSTLLRTLAGLLTPAAGDILWQGENVADDPAAHAARLRYLAHADALKAGLTVAENLAFWARIWGGAPREALEALGLEPLAELPARMLSAGQRRRLALARLVLAPCPLWLLDEPSVGLDAASVDRLGGLLRRHRAQGGMVVAATHVPLPLDAVRELRLEGYGA